MDHRELPRGLIVDVITPLSGDNRPDIESFSKLLKRFALDSDAFLISSPRMGNGLNLSIEDRLRLLEVAIDSLQGGAPIFFYITFSKIDDILKLIFELNKRFDPSSLYQKIVLVDSPLYYHSNRGLRDLYNVLSGATKYRFCLYNDPELIQGLDLMLKRQNIRTAILKELIEIEQICGIICYGNFSRIKNYEKAARKRPEFLVYDGDEMRFLEYPNRSGVVSGLANLDPFSWKRLVNFSLGLERPSQGQGQDGENLLYLLNNLRNLQQLANNLGIQGITRKLMEEIG